MDWVIKMTAKSLTQIVQVKERIHLRYSHSSSFIHTYNSFTHTYSLILTRIYLSLTHLLTYYSLSLNCLVPHRPQPPTPTPTLQSDPQAV